MIQPVEAFLLHIRTTKNEIPLCEWKDFGPHHEKHLLIKSRAIKGSQAGI